MRILITGGSGTIGKAFIREFPEHTYYNVSRNEKFLTDLMREHPKTKNYIGNIEDKEFLVRVFKDVKPDVVVHSAAMKHIDLMEQNPNAGCNVNVLGSLNVVEASIINEIPITIGISTDKACLSESVYGSSKYLMERVFMNSNNDTTKFCLTRFANVAHSNGSVLPFWLKIKKEGKPLKLTDPKMNRLIFTQKDAAELIMKTITYTEMFGGGFVGSTRMKTTNMLDLAKVISDDIDIIGHRPGEKVNEDLISEQELDYTYEFEDYIMIKTIKNDKENKLDKPYSSATAEKMSTKQMEDLVWNTK